MLQTPPGGGVRSLPVSRIALSAASDRDAMLYQFTSHDVQLITADLTRNHSHQRHRQCQLPGRGYHHLAVCRDSTCGRYSVPAQDAALRRALGLGINRSNCGQCLPIRATVQTAQFPVSPALVTYTPSSWSRPFPTTPTPVPWPLPVIMTGNTHQPHHDRQRRKPVQGF